MTVPDIDSLNSYGGALNNYAPVEDPTTDRDANAANKAYASTAAMTQTTTRAWARLVCAASTGALALATTNPNDGLWPNINANLPTLLRNGTGDFTLTWPVTVLDSMGVSHSLNFRAARVMIEGTLFGFANAEAETANSIRVRLANASGAPNDFTGRTILVEAI